MYDPIVLITKERQAEMLATSITAQKLNALRPTRPALRGFMYNTGSLLIAFGTRLKEANEPQCTSRSFSQGRA